MQSSGLLAMEPRINLKFHIDRSSSREFQRLEVKSRVRKLKGQSRASLVLASDGRHYIEKVASSDNEDRCFNEAFGTQLARALGLPFPKWAALKPSEHDAQISPNLAYGSELVSGDIFEYLPGEWYPWVANRDQAFSCLLFDLWCNHSDARQVMFQQQGPRQLRACFIDNDRLFSQRCNLTIKQRIAQARYWDIRFYTDANEISTLLQVFAEKIRLLTKHHIAEHISRIPRQWGSSTHRRVVLTGLQDRMHDLDAYITEIELFAASVSSSKTTRSRRL